MVYQFLCLLRCNDDKYYYVSQNYHIIATNPYNLYTVTLITHAQESENNIKKYIR